MKNTSSKRRPAAFSGVLLGTAVGDSLGLPAEGMSRQRIRARWGGLWRHRFLLGHGMVSDDTEHTLFVAQALLSHPDDPAAFQRCLSWKLRLWLLGLPAGIGLATLKAILKLWVGISPGRSGVWSAGNGPAMRSAIIWVYNSVPVALYAWLRHRNDFRQSLESALNCGGDTDTVGAIVGAILGACVGKAGLPAEWIAGVREWPRSVSLLEQVAARLAQQKDSSQPLGPVHYFWPGLILRNFIFLIVVLIHGLRRLAPPY